MCFSVYLTNDLTGCCYLVANLDESYNSWSLSDDEDNDGNRWGWTDWEEIELK